MRSVDLRLIARAVLDALRVEVLLDIFGDSTLHGDRIHSAHVFIYTSLSKAETKQKKGKDHGEPTCSLPTRHPALLRVNDRDTPVEMSRRAGLNTIRRALHLKPRFNSQIPLPLDGTVSFFTCMISSQFGQPLRRKSMGVCMIEQRRQARKFFDFACGGIGAAGVEDAMAVDLCNAMVQHSRLTTGLVT